MMADGKQRIKDYKMLSRLVTKSLHVSPSDECGHTLATDQNADGQYVQQLARN